VNDVNGMTGSLTLSAGSNISITPSGNTLTIDASGVRRARRVRRDQRDRRGFRVRSARRDRRVTPDRRAIRVRRDRRASSGRTRGPAGRTTPCTKR
jgi:hypothetical protein